MKQIFDAIRAAKNELTGPLGDALRHFERANRGHSHLLDELALERSTKPSALICFSGRGTQGQARRAETLRNSTRNLMNAIQTHLSQGNVLTPECERILDIEDSTQYLRMFFESLRWANMDFNPKFPRAYRMEPIAYRFEGKTLILKLSIQPTLTGAMPKTAEICINEGKPDTLRGILEMRTKADKAIETFAAKATSDKRFIDAFENAQKKDLSRRLNELLEREFNAHERQWLKDNLSSIRL